MGFSQSVTDKALVACDRCCCICHKFCGSKIELHHIKQRADGVDDSFDNCIPLCFDCHADMGKGDTRHPKGKRYSENELKMHRDNWYKKVENSIERNSPERIAKADIELFERIHTIFTDEMRVWLSQKDLGEPHPQEVFFSLGKFLYDCGAPEFEFLNIELEKLKGNLLASIQAFVDYKAYNTFPRVICDKNFYVTREWMVDHDDLSAKRIDEYHQERQHLNDLASTVWDSYCEFYRQGRRMLNH